MTHPETDLLAQAKVRLPLPALMALLGHGDRAKKSARCPFHEDSSASFSVFTGNDGEARWKCFAGCGQGDAIDFLARARHLGNADACREYIKLAGVTAPRPQPSIRDSQPFDWSQCVRDFTPDHAGRFAQWRSLSPEFVAWLHDRQFIGLFRRCLAFPVHDAGGAVVRAHVRAVQRQPDGSESVLWFYSPKGPGLPLVIGDARTATTVWAFESQFDLLAALDLAGWHNLPDGLPGIAAVATRGAENGKRLAGLFPPAATLLLFPQNDPPRPDRAETPAQKWTREAAAHAGCQTVHLVSTPGDFKDLNDALRAGLTSDEFQAALAAAQPYTPPPDLHAAPPRNVSKPAITLPPEDEADPADSPQPFPVESLPPKLAGIAVAVARCERVPAALPAVCALGVASGALGAGLEIVSAPDRVTRANLFLLASAESGSGKSQVFRRIAEPIVEHQHQLHETFREKTAPQLASEIAVLNREVASLEKKTARSTDDTERQRMLGELEYKHARLADLKQKNAPPCITCGDVTSEKLAVLLAMNRETLFSASPEARQIVDIVCGRYNATKSTDEAIYLSGFSGDFLRVDRLGRDPLTLRRPCLSVLWLVQPDALARLFDTETLAQSGFLPRFLVCHTQAAPRKIESESQGVSKAIRAQWAGLVAGLLATCHAAEKPFRVEPTPEAKRLLDDFFNAVVDRRGGDLADVGQFASRYGEQAWRVALVLHAGLHGADAHQHPLDAETARHAIAVVEWFVGAQLNVLARGRRQAAAKLEEEVFELIESNRERKGQDFLTARDVQRARLAASADAARALLDRMERDGLLVGEDVTPAGGGKTTRIFRRVQNPVPE
jgi:hypothetical protein